MQGAFCRLSRTCNLLLQCSCDRLLSIFFPFSAFGRSAREDDGSPSAQAPMSGSTIVAFHRSIARFCSALTARAEREGNALGALVRAARPALTIVGSLPQGSDHCQLLLRCTSVGS